MGQGIECDTCDNVLVSTPIPWEHGWRALYDYTVKEHIYICPSCLANLGTCEHTPCCPPIKVTTAWYGTGRKELKNLTAFCKVASECTEKDLKRYQRNAKNALNRTLKRREELLRKIEKAERIIQMFGDKPWLTKS